MDLFGPQLIDQFNRVKETDFKGETYLVRDNGAVLRKSRTDRRKSRLDEVWTFGKKQKDGYMRISTHYVHIIVAHAFHGAPPTADKKYVDHKDTTKSNNRPVNLEWVTWLENLLRNPLSRRKIINSWGSLEKFFEAPNKFNLQKNSNWTIPLSEHESEEGKKNFIEWARQESVQTDKYVNEFLASQNNLHHLMETINTDVESLSLLAIQRDWRTPSKFPHCPKQIGARPLEDYCKKLKSGSIFASDQYKDSIVVTAETCDSHLAVVTKSSEKDPVKPWAVAKITMENGKFVHEAICTCFDENSALNELYKLMGRPALRDSIENYL